MESDGQRRYNVYIVTRRSRSQSSKDFDLRYKLQGPSRGGGFIFKRNARNTSAVGIAVVTLQAVLNFLLTYLYRI